AGTGFRAPSPYELYAPYGAGNPKLTPEKSRSFDLGVERRFGKDAYLKATAFWLSADNLIDYSNASYSYIQVPGTSRRSGIEVEGQTRLGAALVTATYTYTDSSVNASSSWASVPRDVVSLRASAPVSKKVTVDASARAGFGRSGGLANYAVAGLGLSYAVTDRVSADLRVDNLFDARYQLVKDYQMPRRSIYVGLRAAF
ncbi:MAG: TonB-dependent receptor, partial [Paracoccaceae bacterium]|nr:TonB-dependent receptor [Paracoccaceae bacterium]